MIVIIILNQHAYMLEKFENYYTRGKRDKNVFNKKLKV